MENVRNKEVVFAITLGDLQSEAQEYIGRRLTDEEILIAKKGLEGGLLTDINTIYKCIFLEMIKK
jgi:hypothetical protein